MNETLPDRDIVILGAGHTNAHVIRMWRMDPIPGARLTCISNQSVATYSGMLAGTLAGHYDPGDMEIDLVRLCASCGVRFIQADVVGLDLENRRLELESRPAVNYDLLSIGIGSRPLLPPGGHLGLSIKPMQTFLQRLSASIDKKLAKGEVANHQIAIVGGGAAGVEVACCLQEFLKREYSNHPLPKIILVEGSNSILNEMPSRSIELATQELRRRDIECRTDCRIAEVTDQGILRLENGDQLRADLVVWATSAQPPPLLGKLGLETDKRGFLLTRNTLQSTSSNEIFVVGDSGTVEDETYAKAGVYAVRQAPILWENLHRNTLGRPLLSWQPQTDFLSLIATGGMRAILTYRGLSFHAGWCWRLKDWIDSRFMTKYQRYDAPSMMPSSQVEPSNHDLSKQCGGCGSKASARVLMNTLPTLNQPSNERVLLGLDSPDDIALLTNRASYATAVSTDFFSAFVDDPFLLGRIAALNALSDLYAKGATPQSALSIAILPAGTEKQQSCLLSDLLEGAAHEFRSAGVSIVGGHSIVGPRLTFGFTILGDAEPDKVLRKSALSNGDCLVLTKPLGTGVLLAAHMQAACRAEWWTPLIETMLISNRAAATAASELPVSAATDVTGFGLAAHLQEMLKSTGSTAELSLQDLPLLPGAGVLLENTFESTLAPSNREACTSLKLSAGLHGLPATQILFDPQTSGGLLLAVPPSGLDQLLSACGAQARMIGRVVDSQDGTESIRLLS